MKINSTDCVCVVARRAQGKTTLLKALIKKIPPSQCTVLFDPEQEFGDVARQSCEGAAGLARHFRELLHVGNRIQVLPSAREDEYETFLAVVELINSCRNVTLVADEINTYMEAASIRSRDAQVVRHLIRRGRHNNNALWGAGHRPSGMGRLYTSQARMFMGYTTDERDRQFLDAAYGELPWDDLADFEFLCVNQGEFEGIAFVNLANGKAYIKRK